MTDWTRLGPNPEAAYEQHRVEMVEHFVDLFRMSPEYSRSAVAAFIRAPQCNFPNIGHDVKARLLELGLLEK